MMDKNKLMNVNVKGQYLLPTPAELRELMPLTSRCIQTVHRSRQVIADILDNKDTRLFIVVGPCSIHDVEAATEYAKRLKGLADTVGDKLFLVLRVYFEKPRTTVGWKGLINDPYLDDSFHIEEGLKKARGLLIEMAELGLSTATEALDPITPQYLAELITWSAIGARTTESQTHRELASGLSTAIGFKNGTDGNMQVAIDAMKACLSPHHFLGIDQNGRISVFMTQGNPYGHVVLRGGHQPNYDAQSVAECAAALKRAGLREKIMIDCSHGNSNKDHRKQPEVFGNVIDQVLAGNKNICGMMIESNLHEGNQSIPEDLSQLKYGVSVTDKCIDWETTEAIILQAHKKLT
jgi:3-deoxy-7-phosphoheptulonate synthase